MYTQLNDNTYNNNNKIITTTTIFNEFHATSYSCLVYTISKNASLGWTIIVYIIFKVNGYKK